MSEAGEEKEAAGRRRRRARGGVGGWLSASTAGGEEERKMTVGKWDHAHRNSSLNLKKTNNNKKHGAVTLHSLREDSDTVCITKEKLYDTWERRMKKKKKWVDEEDNWLRYMVGQWDGMCKKQKCVSA